ncbi:MAG: glycosyltransferase 87 family protein [Dehalogenimonas sp.]
MLIGFILAHIAVFGFVFTNGFYSDYEISAFGIFHQYAADMLSGQIPYLDFPVEYPPVALSLIVIPGLSGEGYAAYSVAFTAGIVFFDLLMLVLLAVLSRRLGLTVWKTLAVYTLALLAIGPIIALRYDLAVACLVLLAVLALIWGNTKTCWVILGLAVMAKIYAVVLVPLFLIWHWRRGEKRELVRGGVAFGVTLLAVSIVPLLVSAGGYIDSFLYHSDRPLQIESLYASALLAGEQLGWFSVDMKYSFGSVNLVSPVADFFAAYYWVFVGAGLMLVYWLFDRFLKKTGAMKNKDGERDSAAALGLVAFTAAAITVFMIFNKVLSPQFIIWLYPLIPLLRRGNPLSWILFVAIGFMTAYVYPLHYIELQDGEAVVTWVLLARNVLLLGLLPLMIWGCRRLFKG